MLCSVTDLGLNSLYLPQLIDLSLFALGVPDELTLVKLSLSNLRFELRFNNCELFRNSSFS